MERLEAKKVAGHTYYYYSEWGRVNGKCRRKWQKYLGRLKDIVKAVTEGGDVAQYAEVFEWGLPMAMWQESALADVVGETNKICPKREQGFSVGEYLAIAAINRAISPKSKRGMWEWFSQTALVRQYPHASAAALTSQRFWDHMSRIDAEQCMEIWRQILKGSLCREAIDVSEVSYDGTNFYTFIDTFNMRCDMAKRGKNKQGRSNLRQLSYALFCTADGHVPLYYDVYEGNRNDAAEFPVILNKFGIFLKQVSGCARDADPNGMHSDRMTVVFDKGCNSETNFKLLDTLGVHFVGSMKLDEHPDLRGMSNDDERLQPCEAPGLEGTRTFRVEKTVHEKTRVVLLTYSQNLFDAQWLTLHNDVAKALGQLAELSRKLQDRSNGVVTRGKAPTAESVKTQCGDILSRQHLKTVINIDIGRDDTGIPRLKYAVNTDALHTVADTLLGKTILVSSRTAWSNDRIVQAYRSQYIIEDVFKEMKNRTTGSWWPMHLWTPPMIRVHGLYCSIALLLRAIALRRVRKAGVSLSLQRFLTELDAMREVIAFYPSKRRTHTSTRTMLTKMSELQEKLISILKLKPPPISSS